ncbi:MULTISPECIES: thiamine-phosphate kinase [Nitrosomonas]|uniref:Thiamine-monophosphate kinase n=1 Tax=Nitrosomonas communis TaxID=44574 RepID=A0A0F7KGA0_9PROT|nr:MULTISPECIES: thiamine-phosphate kinase [Nitrosomonas]AKH37809.1 thiamine monophosphate kinase [Nitrosomonas communis]TYP84858.1 thiamine-monophosphate kinase [Nitrosomonas communis]UVS63154.1 thiamine-phosphate kinase [Nitrosomonas sp. PLL12]
MSSEFDIIRRYFTRPTPLAILGIGDDAALIPYTATIDLAISTDTLVVDQHFFADADPYKLGHKALAVNLSDMAAMGAIPRWSTLSLTLPANLVNMNSGWLEAFTEGFFTLASKYQVELIGGDTTCGPLNIGIQIIGEVPKHKALRRNGAIAGDDIWISGHLGNAALALAHLQQRITLAPAELAVCLPALDLPNARVELGQRLINLAHSAIDVSDGLLADLGHILECSHVAATLQVEKIACSWVMQKYLSLPLAVDCLLAGGDDYELCFTAPEIKFAEIMQLSQELALPLSRIGKISQGEGLLLLDANGNSITYEKKGYDHFLT